jgi:hypothetical protein
MLDNYSTRGSTLFIEQELAILAKFLEGEACGKSPAPADHYQCAWFCLLM